MKEHLEERLKGLGNGDTSGLEKLQEQVNAIDAKQVKDSAKLENVDSALEKVKKELAELDAVRIRRDLDKLHSLVHQFATKADLEKFNSEIARIRSVIADVKDDHSALKDRVAKLEDLMETNMKWTKE
jgi:chromosome segregation ATPase